MRYYAKVEKEPTEDDNRDYELLPFEHSENEPITPYEKAFRKYGDRHILIEVISEEEM